jgi:hypothetical protein
VIISSINEKDQYLVVRFYIYTLVNVDAYFCEKENKGWYEAPGDDDDLICTDDVESGVGDFIQALDMFKVMFSKDQSKCSLANRVMKILYNMNKEHL